jgi:predicted transcriptional regulator
MEHRAPAEPVNEDSSLSKMRRRKSTRGQIEIIADILKVCMTSEGKTRIMYRANLSFRMLNVYLNLAIKHGLVEEVANHRKLFRTTERGREYLTSYLRITQLIPSFAESPKP